MFPNVGIISLSTLNHYDIKKLYGFFDNQGIFLIVENFGKNSWSYTISTQNNFVFSPKQINRHNREEIEIDGFFECFKLLNKNVNVI
jgi:hypothetical protein